ncbi:coatomer subunit delta-like [Gigantopelta aegis]|uniref:coatomer subunit delta-like n=1 Tax=Gigantopelta aegis TaxID=1735272 RepID=UPI001B8879EC|nr:coatomer subunit delta-like [Gigantopelta aegis]
MVLLASAVCNKSGKAIISRQFVEMTRSRIEGLLAAFPKLMNTGKQHTFVETESVRYVYQPLEKLYILLITTKASNILEDLETLRLFAKVIPEYCHNMEEADIVEQSFSLIFAFDEIVALGYRENVNLAQIRTFTEMDSHEEKVFQAVRQTQEKEAIDHMRRKAKEIQQKQKDMNRGTRSAGYGQGGFGSSSYKSDFISMDTAPVEPPKPSYTQVSKPSATGKALKLSTKKKDVDTFVGQLESEGEKVSSSNKAVSSSVSKIATPAANQESIHVIVEEKIALTAGRDGGLENMEIHGMVKLKITEDKYTRVRINVVNNDDKGIQIQTHPNIDKKLFMASSCVGLKHPEKPFPLNTDIGVLKWRFQTQDDSFMPLSINCWPSESSNGCDVNIEYELEKPELELENVIISIPCPSGAGSPVVGECDGDYSYDTRNRLLQWNLPVIDASNKSGSMEFSINGHPDDFFPVNVSFVSKKPYCDIQITDVRLVDDNQSVRYSDEVIFYVEKYEIV